MKGTELKSDEDKAQEIFYKKVCLKQCRYDVSLVQKRNCKNT